MDFESYLKEYFEYEFHMNFNEVSETFGEKRVKELYSLLENIDISNGYGREDAQSVIKDWYWKNHDDVFKKRKRGM